MSKKIANNKKTVSVFITIIIAIVALILQTNIETSEKVEFIAEDDLKVYFIDVGQADSILVINKDETMLIDAGENEDGEYVVEFIKNKGITRLNYVIGTHPHEDHIGGLDDVINNFEIDNIFMPKVKTNTKTYEDVLDAVKNRNLKISSPKKGANFYIGDAKCEIMIDSIIDETNLNLSSIVIGVEFGNKNFLFMGDAETKNENSRNWTKVDVLKVGHHGSDTSSSKNFLNQIKPEISVIMVGRNNIYNLPKNEIINKLKKVGSDIYRTDIDGTILIKTDGNEITINKSTK